MSMIQTSVIVSGCFQVQTLTAKASINVSLIIHFFLLSCIHNIAAYILLLFIFEYKLFRLIHVDVHRTIL